jgi:hypothetical protein
MTDKLERIRLCLEIIRLLRSWEMALNPEEEQKVERLVYSWLDAELGIEREEHYGS